MELSIQKSYFQVFAHCNVGVGEGSEEVFVLTELRTDPTGR